MFLNPTPVFMYISSVAVGMCRPILWTAQGAFMQLQSSSIHQMSRNTGIFLAMYQCSRIFGNIYVYIAWLGYT